MFKSADIGSDHSLLVAHLTLDVQTKVKSTKRTTRKYDVEKLQNQTVADEFKVKIGGAFELLLNLDLPIDDLYDCFKTTTNTITKNVVGYKRKRQVHGMPPETARLCEERRKARLNLIHHPTSSTLQARYRSLNKKVKKAVKRLKEENLE